MSPGAPGACSAVAPGNSIALAIRRRVELPARPLLEAQAARLAAMRARLLRRADIARRGPVLDLGAGWGSVTGELVRRSAGPVVAVDHHPAAVAALGDRGVLAEASKLPFDTGHFALLFCQCVLLHNPQLEPILAELRRVLAPGGVLVVIEPDYGGMMEYPPAISLAALWRAALRRAGAEPLIGRRLAPALHAAGFAARVDLIASICAPEPQRFELLRGLPLEGAELEQLSRARIHDTALAAEAKLVHLPFVCVTARPRR